MTEKKSKTGVYGLLAKIGTKLLPILGKILKATKVLKFALLAASLGAYAYLWTWKFAVLIIVALYWHEMGHITAAKHMGIKTKGIFFIPILGAVAVTDGNIKSYGQWSYVALAGPVSGLVQTLICCAAYYMTGIPMLAGAAGFIAFINVFNLAPLSMLDGGQVFRAITFSINRSLGLVFLLMSLIAAVFVAVKIHAALFAFLIILGSVDFISEFFKRRSNIKIRDEWIKFANDGYAQYTKLANETDPNDNSETYGNWKDYYTNRANELKDRYTKRADAVMTSGPTNMKLIQIAYTVAAYALTTIALIAIIKLMAQVPGAELANTFLAS